MSLIAKNEGGVEIKQLEPGVYTGIASAIIDLGIQESAMFGNKQRKIMIIWQIVGETIEINGENKPRVMSKEYTLSLSEKSTLRKDLQAWRGKAFSQKELQGFDLVNILNVPCQLQIIQTEKNGKVYTSIASIMAIQKGLQVEKLDEVFIFDSYDATTWDNLLKVPKWIIEKIKKCLNQEETGLNLFLKDLEALQEEQEGKKNESLSGETNIGFPF